MQLLQSILSTSFVVAVCIFAFFIVTWVESLRKRLRAQSERLDRQYQRLDAQISRLDEHAEWLRNLGKLREREDERLSKLEAQVRDLIGDGR